MASHIPPAQGIELSLHGKQYGTDRVNVFGYRYQSVPPSPTTLATFCGWWRDNVLPTYLACCVTTVTFQYITARLLGSSVPIEGSVALAPGTAGTRSTPGQPGNVTAVLSKRTQYAGRSYRGRNYMPGIAGLDTTGDTLSTGYLALLTTLAGKLLLCYVSEQYCPAVLSWVLGHSEVLANITIDNIADSMRRRLTGRGT